MPRPEPTAESDESLGRRIAAGDRAARDELLRRWSRLPWELTSRVSRGLRADAVGDATLALVEEANRYHGVGRFGDIASRAIWRSMRRSMRLARWRRYETESLDEIGEPVDRRCDEQHDQSVAAAMLGLREEERDQIRKAYLDRRGTRFVAGRRPSLLVEAERKLRVGLTGREQP